MLALESSDEDKTDDDESVFSPEIQQCYEEWTHLEPTVIQQYRDNALYETMKKARQKVKLEFQEAFATERKKRAILRELKSTCSRFQQQCDTQKQNEVQPACSRLAEAAQAIGEHVVQDATMYASGGPTFVPVIPAPSKPKIKCFCSGSPEPLKSCPNCFAERHREVSRLSAQRKRKQAGNLEQPKKEC